MKQVTEAQHRHCEEGSFSASMGTLRRFRARVFSSVCARVTIREESDGRARIQKKTHRCPGFEQPCRQTSPTRADRGGAVTTPERRGAQHRAPDGSSSTSYIGERTGWSKSGGREEHRL